jgi:integrase
LAVEGGRTVRVSGYGPTRPSAIAALNRNLQARRAGAFGPADVAGKSVFGEYLAAWLRAKTTDETLAVRTRTVDYPSQVSRFFDGQAFARLPLREANRVGVIVDHLQHVADEHGSTSARAARRIIAQTLDMAVVDGVLDHNAARAAPQVKSRKLRALTRLDRSRHFTPAELADLLDRIRYDADAVKNDMCDLAAYLGATGLRIQEAIALRWEDLDMPAGRQHVRGTKRAASDRVTDLPASTKEMLAARRAAQPPGAVYVFGRPPSFAQPRSQRTLDWHRKRVFERAGYGWASWHTFRHTVITLALDAGVPLPSVQAYAGHGSVKSTMAYVGRVRDTSKAASAMSAIMDGRDAGG